MSNLKVFTKIAAKKPRTSPWLELRKIRRRLKLIDRLKKWREAYHRREALLYLLSYDDHILDDMGYSRYDLQSIAHLPLSTDAHQVLKYLGEQRKLPG